jgi:hypothetical protein
MTESEETVPRQRYGPPTGPIVASILAVMGWVVFILVYALFWSNHYSIFQDIIVTVATLVIMGLLIGLAWVIWGSRHAWNRWETH